MRAFKLLMLAGMISLSACASRKPEYVTANCPAKPLIPAALREIPPEATMDLEALILKALYGSETPR